MRSSNLKRRTPLRAFQPGYAPCSICGEQFWKRTKKHSICDRASCLSEEIKIIRSTHDAKIHQAKPRSKASRANHRQHQIDLTRAVFQRWIRKRDALAQYPCITTGVMQTTQWDASHYIPAGRCSALIFHEDNVHRQASNVNRHESGDPKTYRVNLIERIGLERVEFLEGPHPTKKWDIDELKEIRADYAARLRAMDRTA